jgi:hypothetical protein
MRINGCAGQGKIDPSRCQLFPIQDDAHFVLVGRYGARNALRACLVDRTDDWREGSRERWQGEPERDPHLLARWPMARSPLGREQVNKPPTAAELQAVRTSFNRGSP